MSQEIVKVYLEHSEAYIMSNWAETHITTNACEDVCPNKRVCACMQYVACPACAELPDGVPKSIQKVPKKCQIRILAEK